MADEPEAVGDMPDPALSTQRDAEPPEIDDVSEASDQPIEAGTGPIDTEAADEEDAPDAALTASESDVDVATPEGGDTEDPVGPPQRHRRNWAPWLATIAALLVILVVGAWFRFVGIDWDQGQHLHPDERFLTMVTSALQAPQDFLGYMDSQTSTLNPRNTGHDFFVYGTWPITLVFLVADKLGLNTYDAVYLVGRKMSAIFDLLAIFLLFVLGTRLADKRVGLLAAALGACTAFAIQQSHFFTVETATNLFVLLFLVGLVEVVVHRRDAFLAVAGLGLGLALASKVAVLILVPVALVVMAVSEYQRAKTEARRGWWRYLLNVVILGAISFVTLRVADPTMFVGPGWPNVVEDAALYEKYVGPLGCNGPEPHVWCLVHDVMPDALEPYFLPDPRFVQNIRSIQEMVTGYGVDWPPNHQWWGRVAYLFPLKNMVLWGMGLPLGAVAWIGWAFVGLLIARRRTRLLLPWLWVSVLFAYQGFQWTKTMRYFFPIYPALTLLGAYTLVATYDWARDRKAGDRAMAARLKQPVLALGLIIAVVGGTALWGYMVSRIYTRDHTRVAGSRWVYHNIPTAMNLTVQDGQGPGKFMPANHPTSLTFERNRWTEPAGVSEPARVLVPGDQPVTVDGAQLSRVVDSAGVGGPRTVKAWLTTKPSRDANGIPEGIVAQGSTQVNLSRSTPTDIHVPFTPQALTPEVTPTGSDQPSEYYLWWDVGSAPVSGELPILAYETSWDDIVPVGLDGYGRYDNPDTNWGEGFYGESNLDLYADDTPEKVDALIASLKDSDYIVISSNRVYGSTAQLPNRYTVTNEYYRRLFGGTLGFKKLAEFHSYPSLGPLEVNDQPAEEAWHVYDHPKVEVYAKTKDFNPEQLKADLLPFSAERHFTFPDRPKGILGAFVASIKQSIHPGQPDAVAVAAADETQKPLSSVMLTDARRTQQVAAGTWTSLFDVNALVNRFPALAVLWWYVMLLLMGVIAYPALAWALPNLADRGWAVSRAAGLLFVSWLAWLLGSTGHVPHTPLVVWAVFLLTALASGLVAWLTRRPLAAIVRANWRLLLTEEVVFGVLFLVFLGIRIGNPDLWHPWFGGEKPMDFAYLNATLRTVSFPPYDPWFAGGTMNYYYFGFVFLGTLIQLTGIVPWVAYNLAIPSLAAMTGLGVFGLVYAWARRFGRGAKDAGAAGVLGALLAVIIGNLYQVQFILDKLGEVAPARIESRIPGVTRIVNAAQGWLAIMGHTATLNVPTHWWYWNASRAIPGDPITEFPFFTFLYADLHAHMMALPITVLAFTVALSWAILTPEERSARPSFRPWQIGRLCLGALAIGALWPTNTWDFPTYGLVAAGAIAAAQWQRHHGPNWRWLVSVVLRGVPLLVLALLFFRPYHTAYVQPYGSFQSYTGARTALQPYLTVHGIFLFAILSWAIAAFVRTLRQPTERERLIGLAIGTAIAGGLVFWFMWHSQASGRAPDAAEYPSPWLPVFATLMLTIGVPLLFRHRSPSYERFMAWLFVLGVLLTQFVEYVVLKGDIGRMNTVFKFYIQVWIIWAALAAVCVAWLMPMLRGAVWRRGPAVVPALDQDSAEVTGEVGEPAQEALEPALLATELGMPSPTPEPAPPVVERSPSRTPRWGAWWAAAFGILIVCGLLYPVTAARAKIEDRFEPMGPMSDAEREAYKAQVKPGLSGITYQNYARYDDDNNILTLAYDRDAIQWMLKNVKGTPTILEGFREKAYRWGSRYSIYTGLPTVIGWDWHQKQQRNAIAGDPVGQRVADVAEMYNTTDVSRARTLLDQYHVDYVIVGEMEHNIYDAAGLAKFDAMVRDGTARLVYPTPGLPTTPVKIYQLVHSAAAAP